MDMISTLEDFGVLTRTMIHCQCLLALEHWGRCRNIIELVSPSFMRRLNLLRVNIIPL